VDYKATGAITSASDYFFTLHRNRLLGKKKNTAMVFFLSSQFFD